jgi:Tol biopolymer transport system component
VRISVKLGIVAGSFLMVMTATAAMASQTITWVSVSADGAESGSASGELAVSDDGRFVAFRSTAALVPGYDGPGVYVKDVQTGAVDIVSVASDGTQANAPSGSRLDMSADGRIVVFESSADNLVADDTNNGPDVFIHDRETGETTRVLADDGSQGTVASDGAISGDGRYVVFTGQGFDTADDAGGVFVFDRQAGTSERVAGDGLTAILGVFNPAISDDGRYVAFTTREFNSAEDVILFDRQTDTWEVANPRIGDAAPITRHLDISLSGDGRFVAFARHEPRRGRPRGHQRRVRLRRRRGNLGAHPGGWRVLYDHQTATGPVLRRPLRRLHVL